MNELDEIIKFLRICKRKAIENSAKTASLKIKIHWQTESRRIENALLQLLGMHFTFEDYRSDDDFELSERKITNG